MIHQTRSRCSCGGKVVIQDFGDDEPNGLRFEAYCVKCLDCDPNGYSTRREAAQQACTYFQEPT